MPKLMLAGLALVLAFMGPAAAPATEPPNLVTVVTSDAPQTQLMALVLTMQALERGADVRVLLCGPAGDLALEDAPAAATAPQAPNDMSPQTLLLRLLEAGVPIEVCALYLPNKGMGPEALLAGITPALPPAMAELMLAPNTRLLTF